MDLKLESQHIDAALADECNRWKDEIRELSHLIEEQEIILKSDEAKGDRSENAVFQNAANKKQECSLTRDILESKVRSFDKAFDMYSTESHVHSDVIKIGSTVCFTILGPNIERIVKIVPKQAAAPRKRATSETSLLGRALLNKRKGDVVECQTERCLWRYRIEEVY